MKPASKHVTLISNSTPVQQVFGRVCQRFDRLFEKRAFLKHFAESRTEDAELFDAREDLRTLNDFYEEVKTEHAAGSDNELRQSVRGLISNDSTVEENREQANSVDNEFILRREEARSSQVFQRLVSNPC